MTLRQRLVAMVAVALLPAVAALGYFIAAFHNEREREVHDQALRTSQIIALEIERIVTGSQGILETLAFAPSIRRLTEDCPTYLDDIYSRLPQLSGFAIAETGGEVGCSSGVFGGRETLANEEWFAGALRNGALEVGTYTPPEGDHGAFLPIALPITEHGRTRVFATALNIEWLGARLRERSFPSGSVLAIADRNGVLLAREPETGGVGRKMTAAALPLVSADYPGTQEIVSSDGVRRIVGYQPPASTGIGLYVGVGFSTDVAFAPIYASTWRILAFAGIGALAAFVITWSTGDRLFRQPIRQILVTIASWRAGDEAARTGITADANELTQLAASIDEYMDNLAAVRAERHAEETRRALLLREMNHRIKNILAAVQAISNQTFKNRATPDSLRTFGSRLAAMAAAHDLLVSENWEGADLHKTLVAALQPFGLDRQHRFSLDGPPVQITAKSALALSMALHELCTNAAKYGALSVPEGRIAVRWWLAPGEEGQRFHLTWTELDGPKVGEPSHRGFGSRLIQTALASELSGTAELLYREDGVVFALDADARSVVMELGQAAA
jgi:two-component sensor histidine kinase